MLLLQPYAGSGLVYDHHLVFRGGLPEFRPWADVVPAFTYNNTLPYFQQVGCCCCCWRICSHDCLHATPADCMQHSLHTAPVPCAHTHVLPHICGALHGCRAQMLVPTVDTVRFSALLELCLDVRRSVLLTGVTGVGKSVVATAALDALAGAAAAAAPVQEPAADGAVSRVSGRLLLHTIVFSAQTSAIDTQLLIESKLEKKRKNRCA